MKQRMGGRGLRRELYSFLLYILSSVVALLAVLVLAAMIFINQAGYKPRIEAAVSDALDMEVQLRGWLGVGLFPEPHVALNDVRIRNRGTELVAVKAVNVGIDVFRLLGGKLQVGKISLKNPRVRIERGSDGRYNFETAGKPTARSGRIPRFELGAVSVSDAKLVYIDKPSGDKMEAVDCDLALDRLGFRGGRSADLPKRLSFTSGLSCHTFRTGKLAIGNLKLTANAKDGVYDLNPITLRLFGGAGSGSARVKLAGAVPRVDVDYRVSNIKLGRLLKAVAPGKHGDGDMDFLLLLTMQGKTAMAMRRSMKGAASVMGKDLTIHGSNLDQQVALFEDSQSFDLVDAAAFFIVGPFGIVATKGYDFASIFQGGSGSTRISKLTSDWTIDHGVARTHDVALATKQHRIALKGRLNFVTERYDGITIAIVNAKGCPIVQQTIRGPFEKPTVDKPGILKTLLAPFAKLFKGGSCKVFYAGSVAPPK